MGVSMRTIAHRSSQDGGNSAGSRHPQRSGRIRWRALEPALWLLPGVGVLGIVFGASLVLLVVTALRYDGKWTLENFTIVLEDPAFRTALLHNVRLLVAVPILVALALLTSVLLFEGMRGWRLHRSLALFPYILPIPVVALVFGQMLQLNGVINTTLRSVGFGSLAQDWLGNPDLALSTMTAIIVWKELGFGVVLLLARLISIPEDVFEAARMDGAGFFKLHFYITVPLMAKVIALFAIIEAITMISWVFSYVFVITNGQGGPGDATQVSELYIYRNAFQFGSPELAAAAATILFGLTLLIAVVLLLIQRRSRKD